MVDHGELCHLSIKERTIQWEKKYFADFGKENPAYPSVFKVLQKNNPTQKAAAFAEWGPIVNAIVEPDAAVKTKQSASLKSFDDVAD